MPDQLRLIPAPTVGGLEPGGHTLPVPARPTPSMMLRGYCPTCRRWTTANEESGYLSRHQYPKWDHRGRYGHCPGSSQSPTKLEWREPL